jgi:hypothetical protein
LTGSATLLSSGSSVGYIGLSGQQNVLASDSAAAGVLPEAGTITELDVIVDDPPGGAGPVTFTLHVNGSATTLTCSVSHSGNTTDQCSVTSPTVVSLHDLVSLQVNNGSGSYVRDIRWSALLAP